MRKIVRTVLRGAAVATLATASLLGVQSTASASTVYTFFNAAMHNCLDHSSIGLRPFTCNSLNYQQWEVSPTGDISDTYFVRNLNTGACLDDSVIGLRAIGCNTQTYQKWYFGSTGLLENQATMNCMQESSWGELRMVGCNINDIYQDWF